MSAFQVWTIVAVMYLVVITLLSRLAVLQRGGLTGNNKTMLKNSR